MQLKLSDEKLLKIFDWLRFPLISAVIFCHNYGVVAEECMKDSWMRILIEMLSQNLARLAVPIFFFISGFLFFYKVNIYNRAVYFQKLKRRIITLLIPYVIWNLLAGILHWFSFYYTSVPDDCIDNGSYIKAIFGLAGDSIAFPIVYQMWFIRDLFAVVVISPLIYFMVMKYKSIFLYSILLVWILGLTIPLLEGFCLSMIAVCFFSFGAYFSLLKKNFLFFIKKVKYVAYSYPILLILTITFGSAVLHKLSLISGMVLIFILCERFWNLGYLRIHPFLVSSSFFVFAFHEPFVLTKIRKVLLNFFSANDFCVMISYFFSIMLTIILSLTNYYVLKSFFPKYTALLTGGRG